MSATNSTTHYELPEFLSTDKPAWLVDWNGAMNTIDSAIYEAKQAADSAASSVSSVASDLATLSGTVSTQGTSISTLSETLTTAVGNINTINGNITTINSLIGNGTPTTTDQTIIGAINEINANVGDPSDASDVAGSDAFEKIASLSFKVIKTITANQYSTYAAALNALATDYNNLSANDKYRCALMHDTNEVLRIIDIVNGSFTWVGCDSSVIYARTMTLSSGKYYANMGGVAADRSNNAQNLALKLILI